MGKHLTATRGDAHDLLAIFADIFEILRHAVPFRRHCHAMRWLGHQHGALTTHYAKLKCLPGS
ncbi:putative protein without homology [Propionibacterium freudenreichii subsp. shermanii]|nr:putative protein without homology [Propionibacterium freudenreichii subsp. shermanii]